jgi:hypothetical protein
MRQPEICRNVFAIPEKKRFPSAIAANPDKALTQNITRDRILGKFLFYFLGKNVKRAPCNLATSGTNPSAYESGKKAAVR